MTEEKDYQYTVPILEIICITTIAYIGIKKQFIKSKITTKKESTEVD